MDRDVGATPPSGQGEEGRVSARCRRILLRVHAMRLCRGDSAKEERRHIQQDERHCAAIMTHPIR